MKLKFIAAVVAAIAAQSSFALSPSATQTIINANTHVLHMSGASATVNAIRDVIASPTFCQAGTFDHYANGSNFHTYSCHVAVGAGTNWDNQDVVIEHGVANGSLTGILGMSTNSAQQNQFINTGLVANCSGATPNWTCTASALATARSNGGFSDVEKALFQDVLDATPPTGVDLTTITVEPVNVNQAFGLLASYPLYRALQTAQGLPANCKDDSFDGSGNRTAVNGADDFSSACQPSVTREQYASAVFQSNVGTYGDDSLTPNKWNVVGLSDNQQMFICRRVPTSGTQATSNNFFLNRQCSASGGDPARAADSIPNAYTANEGVGTGDALACLNLTVPAATAPAGATRGTQFRWGVASAENIQATTNNTWKFVKVNGVSINEDSHQRKSAAEGRYEVVSAGVLHYSTDTSITPADQLSVMEVLKTNVGNPAILTSSGINGSFADELGGLLFGVNPNSDTVGINARATAGNNCSPYTRLVP